MVNLIFLFLLIGVDIVINWYWIEKLKKDPDHNIAWIVRAVLGLFIAYQESIIGWIIVSFNTMFIWWFFFDTGLNIVRGKKIIHLGKHFIDRLQSRYIGEYPAFVFKAIIALGCLANQLSNFQYFNFRGYPHFIHNLCIKLLSD